MWKRTKNSTVASRQGFSLVHRYIQHFNEVSGNKSASIRRRSKTPGVTITQYVPNIPEGKSTPDFQGKPAPVTIKQGQVAVFKAVVTGEPKPEVSWKRTKGNISDRENYHIKYNEETEEYILEIHKVSAADVDTFKCLAVNDYGKALCTTTLNVTDASTNPSDFRKLLRKIKVEDDGSHTRKNEEEEEESFWNAMLRADKKDYERICNEFGVADLHLALRRLEVKRRERAHKDGIMLKDGDATEKHSLRPEGRPIECKGIKQVGKGLAQLDEEADDLLSTEYKISRVDFVVKIQEVKAQERENALFECVLTQPLPRITWMGKSRVLEESDKYSITVSDHKLIHRLVVRDCMQLDKGIYSAVAGTVSCNAWLVVEADRDPASVGKKKPRKTTMAGGASIDIEKVAKEQQMKNKVEMEKILAAVKAKQAVEQLKRENKATNKVKGVKTATVNNVAETNQPDAPTIRRRQREVNKNKAKNRNLKEGSASTADESGVRTQGRLQVNKSKNKTRVHYEKTSGVNGEYSEDEDHSSSEYSKHSEESEDGTLRSNRVANCEDDEGEKESEVPKIATDRDSLKSTKKNQQKKYRFDANFEEDEDNDENGNKVYPAKRHSPKRTKNEKSSPTSDNELDEFEEDEDGINGNEIFTCSNRGSSKRTKKIKQSNHVSDNEADNFQEDEDENNVNAVCTGSNRGSSKKTKKIKQSSQASGYGVDDIEEDDAENKVSTGFNKCSKTAKKIQRKLDTDEHSNSEEEECQDSDQDQLSPASKHSHPTHDSFQELSDENACTKNHRDTGDNTNSVARSKRKRVGPLIQDVVTDPGVQFIWGLSDVNAIIGESAELTCKLSSEECEGDWFRDGKKLSNDANFTISQDGVIHKLVISTCEEEQSGKYRFEADGRKTEAMVNVKDPPRFVPEDLNAFNQPVTVKVGHNAIFKLAFIGHQPIKIRWYREGEELQGDNNFKIERSSNHSRLLLSRCQRKDTGEIKIKLKNEDGFAEAISQLIVLDKPTCPLGPAEVTESSAVCIEFRWRPPKDEGGSPVINYVMERQQVGRNTWRKLGEIPGVPCYRDTDVEHGRKYSYRIRAVTAEGVSEVMETDEMQAGTLAFPGPPAPPTVVDAYDDCINLTWVAPNNTGGSRILGYILERRKKGSNLWTVVNPLGELIKEKKFAVKDVVSGMEYEFRVTAINLSGPGESSNPSDFVCARDPKNPPGKVTGLKVTETSYTHFAVTWTKPEEKDGIQDEANGYFVEIRNAESTEWSRCNSTPLITPSYSVKGLRSMDMYWVRVIATNDGGESAPEELANYVMAIPSPVRPKFTNRKMKSFMVVRAGNSVRITVSFEASPRPEIMWLKDNVPVTKRVTVSNCDGSSQLLIPSSERSDSGVYSILVKNLVGQETFSTEVRVTDDPKPPGPIELEENVPGTVTVNWAPSCDEKRDDRLHYIVSKLDSTKHTWTTVADRLFNNKFTVCNIMQGREYHFRVYAKNDMGISAPSDSATWGREKKKEKFVVSLPSRKDCDLRCAPTFIVPLKLRNAPKGYECYMSCAVTGNPKPRITWYRDNISLNTNTNYYISNTCGVCSMLILRVGPKDMGEYVITAENALGRAECSTVLSVRE